jgi:hypothetical protein
VWGSWLRRAAILLALLAGSQLGHAIVYAARFGLDAGSRQASGVHGYFPALTGVLSAAAGTVLLTALLATAAARSLRPCPPVHRVRATARFFDMMPPVFAAQFLVFTGQETIESLVAGGGRPPSTVELFYWGTLGQLPAAMIATGILTWLLARLESAWSVLLEGAVGVLDAPTAPSRERATGLQRNAVALPTTYPAAFHTRGPPALR